MNKPAVPTLFKGNPGHYDALRAIEIACFTEERQESKNVLVRCLTSKHQEVWFAAINGETCGALVLRKYPKTLRIVSIGVDPAFRGHGIGLLLMQKAEERARALHSIKMSLEVDGRDKRLQKWYTDFGFATSLRLPHYYARGWHALRMVKPL